MVADLTIRVHDLAGPAADRLLRRMRDLTPVMDAIGDVLEGGVERRFDAQVAPDGTPWPPSIRARLVHGQTLTDTARLRRSITHEAHHDRVEVGTNVVYAGTHQFGATIRPVKAKALVFNVPGFGWVTAKEVTIPRREFLGVDREDAAKIVATFEDFLEGELQ